MSVREHPTMPGYHLVDCRPDGYRGKRIRQAVEGSREEALAWERAIMRRHVEIRDLSVRSCAAIYKSWMFYYKANRAASTAKDAASCWENALCPVFGKLRPKHLTRATIELYKSERLLATKKGIEGATTVKHRTINKELAYLSSMLKWAAENDFCDRLPFQITGFSRKLARAPKPRPLTPEQVTAVWQVIDPQYRLVYLLMADAGLRATEALTLRREQVEFEQGIIYVVGKGNKERLVPITTDRLLAELESRRQVAGWLTVNPKTKQPYTSIKKALKRAASEAGLEKHLHHHLLRHSFGTNATLAHFDQKSIQMIMGHADQETTAKYQHLAGEYLRAQGRKMNDLT